MEGNGFSIDVREAAASDAGSILEVQRLAFHGQGVLYGDFSLPPLVQTLEELQQDMQRHVVLKAVRQGRIVGIVRGRLEGDTCRISRLCVHPGYQNRGIGNMLMAAIEERFRGAIRYELFTGHKSSKSLALYEKLGYRKNGEKEQNGKVTLFFLVKTGGEDR